MALFAPEEGALLLSGSISRRPAPRRRNLLLILKDGKAFSIHQPTGLVSGASDNRTR